LTARLAHTPEDGTNRGPQSRGWFTYQDECAALVLLGSLSDPDLEAVVVERSTDLILLNRAGPDELVSVKHREPNRSGANAWTWTALKQQDVLTHLYAAWNAAQRTCTLAFWTNTGLADQTHELWLACAKRDTRGERSAPTPALLRRIAQHTGASQNDALAFLEALSILEQPLAHRADITDVGIQRTADLLAQHRPHGTNSAARECYKHLCERIQHAGSDARDPRDPITSLAATLAQAQTRRAELRQRRGYLERDEIIAQLLLVHDQLDARRLPHVDAYDWEQDAQFTGREQDLQRLDDYLRPGDPSPTAPVVIHGVTGCGKTSLATQYAASRAEHFRPVFVNGANRLSLMQTLDKLSGLPDPPRDASGIAQAAGPVTRRLPGNCATLLVIDGVTDARVIEGIVPRRSLCRVVITSVAGHLDQGYHHLELGPWTRQETRRHIESTLPDCTPEDRDRLARALADHPQSVTQAINYCRAARRPIRYFLRKLNNAPLAALALGQASGHPTSAVESITINVQSAREREPVAFDLLALLAHMGSDPFDDTLFDTAHTPALVAHDRENWRRHMTDRISRPRVPDPAGTIEHTTVRARAVDAALSEEDARDQAAMTLVGLSLAERRPTGLVVHPLVALVVRHLVGDPRPWLEIGLGLFAQLADTDPTDFDARTERHLGHVVPMVETALAAGLYGPRVAEACTSVTQYLAVHGAWGAGPLGIETACQFARRITDVFIERAHAGHMPWPVALDQRIAYAVTLARTGEHQDAEAELLAVIEQAAQHRDLESHLSALLTLSELVVVTDRARRARLVLEQIDRIPQHLIAASPVTVASIAHIKGGALCRLGRLPEAIEVNHAALTVVANATIPERLRADLHGDAVQLARYTKKPQELLHHARAVLQIRRRNSHDRPNWLLLDGLQQCADAAIDAGALPQAEELINEAEALARTHFTTTCFEYAKILGVRGRLHLTRGRLHAARTDLLEAAGILRAGATTDRFHLPAVLVHLAQATAALGAPGRALNLIEEAIEIDTGALGPQHPETLLDIQIRTDIQRAAQHHTTQSLWGADTGARELTWVFARLAGASMS
jgi:hypothetical protein